MNIHKLFNRLAVGVGFALSCSLTAPPAMAEPIVPSGSNPGYLTRIYERMVRNSAMPDLRARNTVTSPISSLTTVPDNPWLHYLKSLPPDQAASQVRGCLPSLCEHQYFSLSESDRFVARIMVLEAMFHDGLNDEEFRTYSRFLSQFSPDRVLQEKDDAAINMLTDNILNSPAYKAIRARLVSAAQITPANAEEQYRLRKNFIEFITQQIRAAYGLATVPTYLDRFPGALNGTAALAISRNYIPEVVDHRVLLFNYNVVETNNVESLLTLTAHEVRHTIDFDMRDMALQGSIDSHDPHFSHVATIHLNQNLYIPLCATGSYGAVSCPEQYEGYRNQYVERSANDFANKLIGKLREKIRDLENNSTLSRLEPQKLQLPS